MSAPILQTEPEQFSAGDSVTWLKSLADYPATDGWSLLYCFRGFELSRLDIRSAGTEQGHLITITTEQTVGLKPGKYSVVGYALNDGQRVQIYRGTIEVTENFETLTESADLRSISRKNRDAILAAIATNSTSYILTSDIGETRIERVSRKELRDDLDYWEVKVRNEEIRELQKQGKPTGRTVFAQFSRSTSADSRNFPR